MFKSVRKGFNIYRAVAEQDDDEFKRYFQVIVTLCMFDMVWEETLSLHEKEAQGQWKIGIFIIIEMCTLKFD